MAKRICFITASLACVAQSQTDEVKANYPRFTTAMDAFAETYSWEPIQFTTKKGYILTSFIVGKAGEEMPNPPVIVHHSVGQDAASWLQSLQSGGETPFIFKIVDKGFPVWMINQRGTEYSRKHNMLDVSAAEYWDFDLWDLWDDLEGNITLIKDYLGYQTFWYVGYSYATLQMLQNFATKDIEFTGKLQHTAFLAPCTIPGQDPPGALELFISGVKVNEFSGPNWESDKQKACTVTEQSTCDSLDAYDSLQPSGLKLRAHLSQMYLTEQVQNFVGEWPKNAQGTPIDLSGIAFRMSFYVNQFDEECEAARAEILRDSLEDYVTRYQLYTGTQGHTLFATQNDFADLVAGDINIEPVDAERLKVEANDYLRKTGGYNNPATATVKEEQAVTLTLSLLATASALSAILS